MAIEPAIISALAALGGSIIGGVTSLAGSWLTQHYQARSATLRSEIEKREALYGQFIDESSRMFADALSNDRDEPSSIIGLYAMVGRMRLLSSPPVVAEAERIAHRIVDAYLAPNMTLRGLQGLMKDGGMDPLGAFADAVRTEIAGIGARALRR